MFKWGGNKDKGDSPGSEVLQSNAVLRVVGDRASGKTTYMAALARWPNADPGSPVQVVSPINEDGEDLIRLAQNILEQGLALEPSQIGSSPDEIKDYGLSIVLKGQFSWKNPKTTLGSHHVTLNISCKDYAGEFFSDILHQSGTSLLQSYLEDCLQATGLLVLIDGAAYRRDAEYANGLDKLLVALDRTDIGDSKRRIALILTKCEQSEIWVNRHKPKWLTEVRFPQVYRKLQSWQQLGAGQVDYFASSAFGMLGTRFQEPNAQRLSRNQAGVKAVLKDPKRWRPFGLVSPIYWLCTGQRHKELDKD